MPGPESLKAKCYDCNAKKWCVDFREGCSANISRTSVCITCTLAKRVEKLEKQNSDKDKSEREDKDKVSNLEKMVNAKDIELKEKENIIMSLKKEIEELKRNYEKSNNKVSKLDEIVKENRDYILETGQDIVTIRNEIELLKDNEDFQIVKGKKKAKKVEAQNPQPTPVTNRFALLAQEETVLIGDSIIRDQANHFANNNKRARKVKSLSGCKTKQIVKEVENLKISNRDSCIIANVGSNDLFLKGNKIGNTEPLIKELESLVDKIKGKTDKGMLVGILPRLNVNYFALSKAIGINNRIKDYCNKKKVKFIDPWNNFMGKSWHFKKDGIHLNTTGSKRLGDILNSGCLELLKNNSHDTGCHEVDPPLPQLIDETEADKSFEGFSKEN
ncbi:MAG: hypothetical protein AAGM46_26485 [Cyanobacteria bacterium J06582_2]